MYDAVLSMWANSFLEFDLNVCIKIRYKFDTRCSFCLPAELRTFSSSVNLSFLRLFEKQSNSCLLSCIRLSHDSIFKRNEETWESYAWGIWLWSQLLFFHIVLVWATLGVSAFSCAVFGFVQMPWPLVAEGRLDYQPLFGAGLQKASEIEPERKTDSKHLHHEREKNL